MLRLHYHHRRLARLFSLTFPRSLSSSSGELPPDSAWTAGDDLADPSWSLGLDSFSGPAIGQRADASASKPDPPPPRWDQELAKSNRRDQTFADGWDERYAETCALMKCVREPGARGEYLKESEKAEMYRLHRSDPEVYTVERLASEFRIMRQRVLAVLWLKEMEEAEVRKGRKLDDSIERLLDECPEFFISHDKEFHVASLRYKPDFKVMPVDWDGTIKDPDEVLYEKSMNEDDILYRQFVEKMNFNKKKIAGEVYHHKHSRRRPSKGWKYTVEKLGIRDKCSSGSAFRFVSMPDGSSRDLNDMEKVYAERETSRNERRILP